MKKLEKILRRSRRHSSIGTIKKAKKISSPSGVRNFAAAVSDRRPEGEVSFRYYSSSYHETSKENPEDNHNYEESLAEIVGRMSEEFLDLYDDLDNWGQDYCAPEEKMVDAKKDSNSNDDHNDEESLAEIVGKNSDELLDLYDGDMDDWGVSQDKILNAKVASDSASELSDDDSGVRRCEPSETEGKTTNQSSDDDQCLIDMELYDDLEGWRDDYWVPEYMMFNSDLVEACHLCKTENETANIEEASDMSYDSDGWNLTIAQLKERLKKNRRRR